MNHDHSSVGMATLANFVSLWFLLTFLWVGANSSISIESVVTGAIVSAVIAYLFTRKSDVWQGVSISPSRLYHFIAYTGVFAVELVKANINMLRYVYARRIEIQPGIVRVKTKLKSPIGRLALANSIALTPGSLVMDIKGDTLFVHWLDVQTTDTDEATRIIASPFEGHLEKVFG